MIPWLAFSCLALAGSSDFSLENPDPAWVALRDECFDRLADSQRGAPESAMERLQMAQIAQEYGVGDLTHRMSQHFSFFRGHCGAFEKVQKTLRALRRHSSFPSSVGAFLFRKTICEQIASNVNYQREKGRDWYSTVDEAMVELRRLGNAYADEHAKLVVWNRAQAVARAAAVAVGRMDFESAIMRLDELKEMMADGEEWERISGEFTGTEYTL
jgi:hypothetical protein